MRTRMALTAAGALLTAVAVAGCHSSTSTDPPPTSQPPATQPPATQPPTTQPPATQPPATQPPTTSNCTLWPGIPDLIALGGDLNSLAQDEANYGEGSPQTSADAENIGAAVTAVSNDGQPPAQYASQVSNLLQTVTAEGDDPGAFGAGYDGSLAMSLANEMNQMCG